MPYSLFTTHYSLVPIHCYHAHFPREVIPLSQLNLRIFDGTRNPFAAPAKFLITLTDGNQKQIIRQYYNAPILTFNDLPFYDNFGDLYSVVVWADGYRQVGFAPVKLSDVTPTNLDLMLVANDPGFSFVDARWNTVIQQFPFLGGDTTAAAAQARYENLLDQQPRTVACFLNLVEAMSQIFLASGTPLTYIKQMRWDMPPQQDRFFAYCDAELVNQVRDAANHGLFSREVAPSVFHPGATNSWKQIQFGEANVQLTFHENAPDTKIINGVKCVTLEPDIDYYRDPGAHLILELIVNGLSHSLTDPAEVYILRWVAGQHAGVPQFAPLYTLTSAVPAAASTKSPAATQAAKKPAPKLKRR